MQNYTTSFEFKISKFQVAGMIFAGAICLGVGGFFLLNKESFLQVLGFLCIAGGLSVIYSYARQLRHKGPVIFINASGITDQRLSQTAIAWNDIQTITYLIGGHSMTAILKTAYRDEYLPYLSTKAQQDIRNTLRRPESIQIDINFLVLTPLLSRTTKHIEFLLRKYKKN